MKRIVLALHASLAHGGAFAPLAAQLPQVTLETPDLLGHGRAEPWDQRFDYHSACTRAILAKADVLAAQAGGPIDMIGHSFGATVVLRAALERPELVRSMVLIEPVFFAAARADGAAEYRAYAADHALFMALMQQGQVEEAAALFHGHWGDGRDFSALPAATRAYITHRLPLIEAQTGALLEDSGAMMGYLRLESCPVPTLLLRGTQSPPVIRAIHRALALRLPNIQEAQIDGAGHMLALTHAADCARGINRFWQTV
jgi:pimeloyl-ACP methyl ester carboxylesterase